MGFDFSYMGTKKRLAPAVAEIISDLKPGIVLDLFSGMCAVGEAIGDSRQVWNNDIQTFAASVARALFKSQDLPPSAIVAGQILFETFEQHRKLLSGVHKKQLSAEKEMLEAETLKAALRYLECYSPTGSETAKLRRSTSRKQDDLFTVIYADTYFGLSQCIEIDSVFRALRLNYEKKVLSGEERQWLMLALAKSMSLVSNTTGHFAQYLQPKRKTLRRFLRQRRRSIWAEWLNAISELCPIGSRSWRGLNRVFNADSATLLKRLKTASTIPSVVYADPPYTGDQYSRYYHLLETLMKYDYPKVSGAGCYREHRFQTPFSQRGQADKAFEQLVKDCALLGADLVVSYPDNGVLQQIGKAPFDVLNQHYRRVEVACTTQHEHSTFGASKGPAQMRVVETVYFGTS